MDPADIFDDVCELQVLQEVVTCGEALQALAIHIGTLVAKGAALAKPSTVLAWKECVEETWEVIKQEHVPSLPAACNTLTLLGRLKVCKSAEDLAAAAQTWMVATVIDACKAVPITSFHRSVLCKALALKVEGFLEANMMLKVMPPQHEEDDKTTVLSVAAEEACSKWLAPLAAPPPMQRRIARWIHKQAASKKTEWLSPTVLRHLCEDLLTSEIGALAFVQETRLEAFEETFQTPPPALLFGLPGMVREARPWKADKKMVQPPSTWRAPKASARCTVPNAAEEMLYISPKGGLYLNGHLIDGMQHPQTLLVTVPGVWKEEGDKFSQTVLAVNPCTAIAQVLQISFTTSKTRFKSVLRWKFLLDTPDASVTPHEEADGDDDVHSVARHPKLAAGAGAGADTATQGSPSIVRLRWVDMGRLEDGTLVLAWGDRNPVTGGVVWAYHMGFNEHADPATHADPFCDVKDADVDAMFTRRFWQNELRADFSNHGSLLSAAVTLAPQECKSKVFLVPTTQIVFGDVLVASLPNVWATAVWGTPARFVLWDAEGNGGVFSSTSVSENAVIEDADEQLDMMPCITRALVPWWGPTPPRNFL